MRRICLLVVLFAAAGVLLAGGDIVSLKSAVQTEPHAQTQAVLDELSAFGGKPLEKVTPAEARKQPTPARRGESASEEARSAHVAARCEKPEGASTRHDHHRQIDPLRSEGEAYAHKLREAGVDTDRNFGGVTHDFFGMGAVVDDAKQAVRLDSTRLKAGFEKK